MTREEAVKAIKSHCYFANLVPVGKEALDMAIEALEQEPCEDTISRAETVQFLRNHSNDFKDVKIGMAFQAAASLVNNPYNLPCVHPIRPKGHWITRPHIYGVSFCSECGFELRVNNTNYCPNCGIRMIKSQESEE